MKVLVIGSLNIDLVLEVDRFPNEGETLLGKNINTLIGGKGANQASAIALQGCDVSMVGMVGEDNYGTRIMQELHNLGIRSHISKINSSTGMALIEKNSQGKNRIVVIPGANACLSPDNIDLSIVEQYDIIVLQFEIPLETVEYIIQEFKKMGKIVVVNPAPAYKLPYDLLNYIDYFIPNEHELALITGKPTHSMVQIKDAVSLLPKNLQIIVTLGQKGVYFANKDILFPAHPMDVIDTTGAGDAFIGGFVGALAQGLSVEDAIVHANKAAAISVTRAGAFAAAGTFEEIQNMTTPKIKKVAIVCSTGITSTLLAKKIQEIFESTHIIEAENYGVLSQDHDYDLIFLSPQFPYEGNNPIVKVLPPNLYNIFHANELTYIIQELLEEE